MSRGEFWGIGYIWNVFVAKNAKKIDDVKIYFTFIYNFDFIFFFFTFRETCYLRMVTREKEIFLKRGRNSQPHLELNLEIIVRFQTYGNKGYNK